MKQLELTHPEHIRESVASECARILTRAAQDAELLRRDGKHARADELLADRQRLVDTIARGSEHTLGRREL